MNKVLGTIRVIICRLDRVNTTSSHLFTQEAWKNIWRDFPFCVQFAERRLYCYKCRPDLTDEIVGIITKIDIGKKAVRANIDLVGTEEGRCLYEKSKESSLVNSFYVCGRGSTERENGYDKIIPESFKLTSIHFQEEPLVYVKPAPLVDSGVTVTETNVSSMTPLTERSAPAGLNRGVLDIIGRGTEENAVEHTITGEGVTPIEHVAIRMEENWLAGSIIGEPRDPRIPYETTVPGRASIASRPYVSYAYNPNTGTFTSGGTGG